MKDFGGISSLFDNAIVPVPGANEQAGGGTKGGVDIPEGMKQSAPGETGTHVTTQTLPGESGASTGPARPKGMAGS